jgi:CubicO group peptidase (beta-lactamase class C family)
MVSTAEDYARFLQMMLNGGTLDEHRFLGPQTVGYMTADQLGTAKPGPYYLPGPGYGFGLGIAVRTDKGVASYPGDVGDWYWGGAGGTYMWVDPAKDMLVVFMMQSPKQRLHYRSVLRDMVNAAIVQ